MKNRNRFWHHRNHVMYAVQENIAPIHLNYPNIKFCHDFTNAIPISKAELVYYEEP